MRLIYNCVCPNQGFKDCSLHIKYVFPSPEYSPVVSQECQDNNIIEFKTRENHDILQLFLLAHVLFN